jgi:hypothetical protein
MQKIDNADVCVSLVLQSFDTSEHKLQILKILGREEEKSHDFLTSLFTSFDERKCDIVGLEGEFFVRNQR